MGPAATRQDVQTIMDITRNRILERTVTKQDIAVLSDAVRQLAALHQQSQQMLKQNEYQYLQLNRRAIAVETRLTNLEGEMRSLAATVNRMAGQKQQPIILPTPVAPDRLEEPGMVRQYGYQPN